MNQRNVELLKVMGIDTHQSRFVAKHASGLAPDSSSVENGLVAEIEPTLEDASVVAEEQSSLHADVAPNQRVEVAIPDESVAMVISEPVDGYQAGSDSSSTVDRWEALQQSVADCRKCGLCESRTQTVFGVGDVATDILFIGEAPGEEEDKRGEPFVGLAGQLLDRMLVSIGLDRQSAFIANTIKCRPPNNRDPHKAEISQCMPYLAEQISLIAPRVIVTLGRVASNNLLGLDQKMGDLRGQPHYFGERQIPVVPMYHPAYLLRSPSQKRVAWHDLLTAKQLLAIPQ